MSSDGPPKRVSKFAGHDAFKAVDSMAHKAVLTNDTQDAWNRFAAGNMGKQGIKRTGVYTDRRHQPAFPKMGQWRADPTGINDGRWKANNEKLVDAAEMNRRKKIWSEQQMAAKAALKEGKPQKTKRSDEQEDPAKAAAAAYAEATTAAQAREDQPAAKKMKKKKKKKKMSNPRDVYMTISIDGKTAGSMHFTLYDPVVPRTAGNFRALCAGNRCVLNFNDILWPILLCV